MHVDVHTHTPHTPVYSLCMHVPTHYTHSAHTSIYSLCMHVPTHYTHSAHTLLQAGTDRTGEVSGAYYIRYLNMSFNAALYIDNHIQNRDM